VTGLTSNFIAAERFLKVLDATATKFTFQTFDDNKERKERRKTNGEPDPLAKVIHGTLIERFDELASLNARGAGVFVTVNETDFEGRTAKNVKKVRALFADLDGSPVPRDCPRPHAVIETSPGRFHVYWRVNGVSLADFPVKQKALAAHFGGDPSVHDLPRVMRLPGFFHRKGTPTMVRIVTAIDVAPHEISAFASITAVDEITVVDEITPEMIRQDARRAAAAADQNP
jgi:hypothetical protein